MKVEKLSEIDIQAVERPQMPIRNKAEQIKIIRSYLKNGTPAEIMDMKSKVDQPDFQPEVRHLFYALHQTCGGNRSPQTSSPSPISFSEPGPSEAF